LSRIVPALLALVVCSLLVSGCATLPRRSSSTVQNRLEPAKIATATVTNINTAGIDELEKLPGVGRAVAERIVAHREQYGPFRRTEHLLMVRGVSDHKFREMRTSIVVE
jgi:competence ComEA-like helix-hairpin-helix protein